MISLTGFYSFLFDSMRLRRPHIAACFAIFAAVALSPVARAVTCVTQSQMTATDRNTYVQAARALASNIQAGNVAAVKAATVASVAAQFDSIASSIQSVAPQIQSATITVNALYLLKASDLKAPQDETQFFCSVPGSSRVVTLSIPQLPPGTYLLAILHATGVEHSQQLSLILENDPAGGDSWKLAGFFVRPLTAGGRDGLWYWTEARNYSQRKQDWNAYLYYQTAAFLLNPVEFLSSPNLEKLQKEAQAIRPAGMPGTEPMVLNANGQNFDITNVRTDSFPGGLDLVVTYKAKDVSDPVAMRSQILELMKALLAQHPELRQAFHGVWVYANAENQRPYAIELPMNQIS